MKQVFIWLDRLHWLWLLLAAPFLLFPNPKRSLAMLVVPATWILHWLLSRRKNTNICDNSPILQYSQYPLPLTPLNSAIFLTALMVLVSIWVTDDLELSLPKISGLILGFGTFFAGVHFRMGLAN